MPFSTRLRSFGSLLCRVDPFLGLGVHPSSHLVLVGSGYWFHPLPLSMAVSYVRPTLCALLCVLPNRCALTTGWPRIFVVRSSLFFCLLPPILTISSNTL